MAAHSYSCYGVLAGFLVLSENLPGSQRTARNTTPNTLCWARRSAATVWDEILRHDEVSISFHCSREIGT